VLCKARSWPWARIGFTVEAKKTRQERVGRGELSLTEEAARWPSIASTKREGEIVSVLATSDSEHGQRRRPGM
jgi:hypothetical protein